MIETAFIITIDTEGDNIWSRPDRISTENARYLPRFQALCDQFGFTPTYLVNYEMTQDAKFREFGRAVLRRNAAEIGLHIHPWYSPPFNGEYDPKAPHLYLYELPDDVLAAKVSALTGLLTEAFEAQPVTHRAGKWGLNERVAGVLADHGFQVDCSVTPGVSWRSVRGDPRGRGGPDYRRFPRRPYFLDLSDISRPGESTLLEVPVTVKARYGSLVQRLPEQVTGHRGVSKVMYKALGPSHEWLRPNGRNLRSMLELIESAVHERLPVIQFMLHSSELMPGGSPTFPTREQIEILYRHLRMLFARLAEAGVRGMTLSGFRLAVDRPALDAVVVRG